jgi:hypothetical protein
MTARVGSGQRRPIDPIELNVIGRAFSALASLDAFSTGVSVPKILEP